MRHAPVRHPATGGNAGAARGLTLLELVIALSILSLIGVVALEAVRLSARSWQKAEQRAEREQRARVLAAMLTADLTALQPVSGLVDGRPVLAFRGDADRLYFHAAPETDQPPPRNGLVRSLAYSVEAGRGLLLQRSYPLVEKEVATRPAGPVEVVDPGVTQLRLRYLAPAETLDGEPRWVSEWRPEAAAAPPGLPAGPRRGITSGAPPAPTRPGEGLPLAIELTLALGEGAEKREMVLLVPVRIAGRL
jgi:prepilin-type N-terminal cleavage/methylation domain-containing protein